MSVIIQENEGGELYGLTSAKETVHMKNTEHYIRLFFSSLFSALPHLDPTVLEPGTVYFHWLRSSVVAVLWPG